jgi:hypothetical protein
MKLFTFFILLIVPGFAIAEEMAAKENSALNTNEQATAPQPSTNRSQHIADAPSNNSSLELNALYGRTKLMTDQDLNSNKKQSDHSDPGVVIEEWRDRVFKTLSVYFGSYQQNLVNDSRLSSNNDPDNQANDGKIVTKLVLNETLKFTREHMPEIDRLVKALKIEVSSDRTYREDAGAVAGDNKADHKTGEARADKNNPVAKDKLFVKTGLRVRVESGKLGLESETEARYGNVSYFYKVNLDNRNDNSLGFTYVFGKAVSLQVERDFTRTMNPVSRDKPNINLVQLGFKF